MQSSSSLSSHNPTTTTTPPPADSPNSSPSSISSDHTFHGFSPLKDNPATPSPSPPPPPPVQAIIPVQGVNRLVRDQPDTVTKTEPDAENGFTQTRVGSRQLQVPALRRARRDKSVKRAGLALRFCEFVVCLVSFSVMAADKNRGWAVDSFDRYVEFRYSMSVNVIGFAYSGLQGLDLLHQLTTGKDLVGSQVRYSFDFAIDQMLAYLLLSASSSAFTRVDDWISNWGDDKFPAMASASVGVSFVAFIAFAFSSLVSGYLLCTRAQV
ncbi:hypothetical protein BVRB_4g096310 [Beta vulgaris subsp. vulgaris]|uniref:CASP-like protein n=2 Tax=Beta vulgaris subsp. vulgaris TaxID=3555 RepID=A0A0J8BDL8_BETVV|nr:hypothetical protein BVRB_4g096310 [Beta vulgaris subsp. vulgaris]